MNVSAVFFWAGVLVAMATLALGYGLGGVWIGVGPVLAVGVLWLIGRRLGWGWVASLGLALWTVAAAVGLWVGLGAGWMLVGVVAALSAWDLDHFIRRLRETGRVERAGAMERTHLGRLLAVDVAGLALGALALGVRIRLGFGIALVLALVAVWGLSRAVRFLQGGD